MVEMAESLPVADRLARDIRSMLISGELQPGQRVSEAAFSERLNVSRNSLREAFRLLTKEGLLQHEANRGVFVSVPSMASIMDIYRVRRLIECGALAQAWRLHPAVKAMRQAVETAKAHRDRNDWQGVGSANMMFHAAVVDLSDSARLNAFYAGIAAELRLGFGLLGDPEHLHAPFIDMNDEIVTLIENDRPAEAAGRMNEYLTLSERVILKAFEKVSDGA
ncbi:GntR family transcriptional regulator [Rhizobium sp. C1]|uniref:GntR family transcriptional regulator n=1 Tax=Rhizobium sp. C1 TaxID=1349799 RepID=UPI001E5C13C6|nr:GntR family transcriptional regulator [Rhizobium sp. C1]MCD2177653.1 GntR family transcriptional regulator [Rhizobium sp. C1]